MIEERFLCAIDRWVWLGIYPGSFAPTSVRAQFLKAIIENDLRRAIAYADHEAQQQLVDLVLFFYNDCPGGCWGGEQRAQDWAALEKDARIRLVKLSDYPRPCP